MGNRDAISAVTVVVVVVVVVVFEESTVVALKSTSVVVDVVDSVGLSVSVEFSASAVSVVERFRIGLKSFAPISNFLRGLKKDEKSGDFVELSSGFDVDKVNSFSSTGILVVILE